MFKIISILCFLILIKNSHEQNLHPQTAEIKDNKQSASIIDQITGVHKKRFKNYNLGLKVNNNNIYFRIHLEFENIHVCNLYGTDKGNKLFVFEDDKDNKCKLAIDFAEKTIKLQDGYKDSNMCDEHYCGNRGSFNVTSFKKQNRKLSNIYADWKIQMNTKVQ